MSLKKVFLSILKLERFSLFVPKRYRVPYIPDRFHECPMKVFEVFLDRLQTEKTFIRSKNGRKRSCWTWSTSPVSWKNHFHVSKLKDTIYWYDTPFFTYKLRTISRTYRCLNGIWVDIFRFGFLHAKKISDIAFAFDITIAF